MGKDGEDDDADKAGSEDDTLAEGTIVDEDVEKQIDNLSQLMM